jgi:hypothetical protein
MVWKEAKRKRNMVVVLEALEVVQRNFVEIKACM